MNETQLSLSICAIQLADIERDVGVVFSAQSQTAISKLYRKKNTLVVVEFANYHIFLWYSVGVDFTAQILRPTFLSGQIQQRLCYNIDIINDQLLESNEVFQVLLTSDDSDLNFSPNSATVTIIDSSSEYFIHHS